MSRSWCQGVPSPIRRLLLTIAAGVACTVPARAAVDRVVVDEFLLRCTDGGSAGAFVELLADGPGQSFDAGVGFRLLGPSGSVLLDVPGVFGSRTGQPWPQGQRFLIATDAFAPLTGVTPDTVLSRAPSTTGSFVLYRRNANNTETLIRRFEYSDLSVDTRAPANGRSIERTAAGAYQPSVQPSPTNFAGARASAPSCFASAVRPIVVQEFATACANGQPAAGFIEIVPVGLTQSLDGDLAVRALDHTGATLFDLPLGFGSLTGTAWAPTRPWLVGEASLLSTFQTPPDLVWPRPLDPQGGRIVVYGTDGHGQELEMSHVDYGAPPLAGPDPGGAWVLSAGRYVATATPTPMGHDGALRTATQCNAASSLRIEEILLRCGPGSASDHFVEIVATSTGEKRDAALALDVYDSLGTFRGRVPLSMGPRAGESWPLGTSWLLGTPGLSNAVGNHPDAPFDVLPDSTGGRFSLVRLDAGGAVESVIQELRYGSGAFNAPAPGQSLVRFGDLDYRLTNSPQPRIASNNFLGCPVVVPPADTAITAVLKSVDVFLTCLDGSRRGQYLQFRTLPGVRLDASFELRLYDHFGTRIGVRPVLFGALADTRPTDSKNWLVGGEAFSAGADGTLPALLDSVGGTIEVVSVRNGVVRASQRFLYGLDGIPAPARGVTMRIDTLGAFIGLPAAPTDSRGATHTLIGCHVAAPPPPEPQLLSLLLSGQLCLGCRDGSRRGQYVQLTTMPNVLIDTSFVMRIRDHLGQVVATVSRPFGRLTGQTVSRARWLFGAPEYPLTVDAVLPVPLDTLGGDIEIVALTNAGERVPQHLRYGTLDLSTPAPRGGLAVDMVPNGVPGVLRHPEPLDSNGQPRGLVGCHDLAPEPANQRVLELFLECGDGSSDGSYLLVGPFAGGREPNRTIGLNFYSPTGRKLSSLYPLIPDSILTLPRPGESLTLLVAKPSIEAVAGVRPDALLPTLVPGGWIRFFSRDTVFQIDQEGDLVQYFPGFYPPPGTALVDPITGRSRRGPRPINLNGDVGHFSDSCSSPVPPLVLQQIALACIDGSPAGQYLQLGSPDDLGVVDSTYDLRIYGHDGALRGVVADLLGSLRGVYTDMLTNFLVAPALVGRPAPDAVLPAPLDTLGGRIEFVERRVAGDFVWWSQAYDRAFLPLPVGGFGLRPDSTGGWVKQLATPRTRLGGTGAIAGCHQTTVPPNTPPSPVVVERIMGACGSGATDLSFIQLMAVAGQPPDSTFGLRVQDASATREYWPLRRGALADSVWPAGRPLLIAGPGFEAATGFAPDGVLSQAFGASTAKVSVFERRVGAAERVVANYVFALPYTPEPGRAYVRSATSGFAQETATNVRRWDGTDIDLSASRCLDQHGQPGLVRLTGLFLGCSAAGDSRQYVTLGPGSPFATLSDSLRLRVLGHDGSVRGELAGLFGIARSYWGRRSSSVLGGNGFQQEFGFPVDAALPVALDPAGGQLQLVLREAAAEQLIDDLRYGPGGLALPAPGVAWALRDGRWLLESTPSPQGLQGSGSASVACGAVCEPQRFRIDGSGERMSRESTLEQGAFETDVRYDLRRRTFSAVSGGLTAGLDLRDSYRIETPDGQPFAVPMHILIEAHDRDSCFRGVCRRSLRRLLLYVDGALVDSLRRPLTDTTTMIWRVEFRPGVPRQLRIVAEAQGVTFGGLEASVRGECVIPELPAGVRLRSCNGADSDDERVVRDVRSVTGMRRAEIEWEVQADAGFRARVERFDESDPDAGWRPLQERTPDASGVLRFTDDRVLHEHAYRYRLSWTDRFGARLGGETRVVLSRSFGFALLGVQPNPAHGAALVAFELPEAGVAQLEVFDVAGRRVRETRVRLEAGPQSLALDAGRPLSPGVYRVRLRADGREARTTAVVIP